MKLSEIKIVLPVQKPRDPNQHVLAAKKNAGGPMRDKKRELEAGKVKHKNKMDEAKKGAWYVVDQGKKILVGPTDHDDAHKQWMKLSDSGEKLRIWNT